MQPTSAGQSLFAQLANATWSYSQRRWQLVVVAMLLLLHVAVFRGVADPWARALLLIAILPEVAPRQEITPETRTVAEFVLPLAFVLIAFFPAEPQSAEAPQIIDFFYSVFLMLLLVVVVLGSFTLMTLRQSGYLEALTYTVFLTAGAVLFVGLAWNPRGGGLCVFFVRYLSSVGVPLERWLEVLARLLQQEAQPERFLEHAIVALEQLPSVAGVTWRAGSVSGARGARTPYLVDFATPELTLGIYSRYRLSPALQWHLRLLAQLLGEFYLAKRREAKLRETSYLQAVHETGARTTHDIKNLLQSLNVLCSAAAAQEADTPALNALVRRQLPLVAERLTQTLERLQRPQPQPDTWVAAAEWWQALIRQYQGEAVEFEAPELAPGARVPRELYDSVAYYLIRNALAKRSAEPGVRVRVALWADGLSVCDTGRSIPENVARTLMRAPIASAAGLGIGLYQAARQAEAIGYRLVLEKNSDGEVCLALRVPLPAQGSTLAAASRP